MKDGGKRKKVKEKGWRMKYERCGMKDEDWKAVSVTSWMKDEGKRMMDEIWEMRDESWGMTGCECDKLDDHLVCGVYKF